MTPLTSKQKQVYEVIYSHLNQSGVAPSFEEIACQIGVSSLATVSKHIDSLVKRGWVVKGRGARSLALSQNDTVRLDWLIANGFVVLGINEVRIHSREAIDSAMGNSQPLFHKKVASGSGQGK